MKKIILLTLCFIIYACSENNYKNFADLVVIGNIYTVDINNPEVKAIAIRDGKYMYIGDEKNVKDFIGSKTEVIELTNGMVLPGFIDAHSHPSFGSIGKYFQVNLYDDKSIEEYANTISNFIKEHTNLKVLRGSGWLNGYVDKNGPNKEVLDRISTNIPIAITSADYHSIWVNSKTLEIAGIDSNSKDIEGGVIERDSKTKEPIGTLREKAHEYIVSKLPDYSVQEYKEAILKYQDELLSYGVIGVYDALMNYFSNGDNLFQALNELDESGELKIKYFAGYKVNVEEDYSKLLKEISNAKQNSYGRNFQVTSVKLYVDGSISSKTAYLLEDYCTDRGYKGDLKWPLEKLKDVCLQAQNLGLQIHIHSIGDGATDISISALEYIKDKTDSHNKRHSITHIQLIDDSNLKRMANANIIAVLNPYWFYKQEGWYKESELPYLGEKRVAMEYPMKSFFNNNVLVTTASDFPVTLIARPLDAIQIGVTRMNLNGDTNTLLNPLEIVDVEDMIYTTTINSAYQNFYEDKIGSIEIGKNADFIILDRNILEEEKTNISKTQILKTFIDGKIVFTK